MHMLQRCWLKDCVHLISEYTLTDHFVEVCRISFPHHLALIRKPTSPYLIGIRYYSSFQFFAKLTYKSYNSLWFNMHYLNGL